MRIRHLMAGAAVVFLLMVFQGSALAHFGMVIPSDNMVMQEDNRSVTVTLSFSHPMEMVGMELVKPKVFAVGANGKAQDLLGQLKPAKIMDHNAWKIDYAVKRPGVYMFHMEPQPYWEPAEDCFIVHYTKTVVTAFGDDEGWDEELGLKTEIVPLSKPYGLYAGNVFQGVVKMDGKPIPYAEVEVEYYNQDGKSHAPTDYMVTPDHQSRRQRRLYLRRAQSGVVGIRGPEYRGFQAQTRRPGKRCGNGRRDLGPF